MSLAVVATAVVLLLAPINAGAIEEWYATGFYPHVQRLLTPLSNLVPFALFDMLVIGVAVVALVWLVAGVRQARKQKSLRPVLSALLRLGVTAASIYLLFLLLWGFNYRRVPITNRIVLDRTRPSTEAVVALGMMAVERLNELHGRAHSEGWRTAPWRERSLRDAYAQVQQDLADTTPSVPGRLKWTLLGPYFRWTTVDGMINPFALEALANPDLLPFERPFVAAHEWAHLAGYADESEASFVGWLTCVRASVPAAYSGWLFLYWQISAEVPAADSRRLAAALGEGPRQDVAAVVERLRRGQIQLLQNVSWRVYDQYLKVNRVEEGVRSYGLVVSLLVQARFDEGWTPVRRTIAATP